MSHNANIGYHSITLYYIGSTSPQVPSTLVYHAWDLYSRPAAPEADAQTIIEPAHEVMALFVLRKLILLASGARCLIFGRTLRLLPYFMCVNSEGSGETARMRRLAWAFAGRQCDKYHNLMSWLNYCSIRDRRVPMYYFENIVIEAWSAKHWSQANLSLINICWIIRRLW